ncbi:hypothetical protein BJ508DRAFT_334118 [Ascobolus immersus RN42]|uniref:Uncharacterized protein n=1 Tax=Ascobolus immersus RN42 TaxID=1160509 RepID=A0A3N4HJ47_ASCIM|nr:hypothetical protein BJ508DRAFT_334118 [Ascobolus immersus RN42]
MPIVRSFNNHFIGYHCLFCTDDSSFQNFIQFAAHLDWTHKIKWDTHGKEFHRASFYGQFIICTIRRLEEYEQDIPYETRMVYFEEYYDAFRWYRWWELAEVTKTWLPKAISVSTETTGFVSLVTTSVPYPKCEPVLVRDMGIQTMPKRIDAGTQTDAEELEAEDSTDESAHTFILDGFEYTITKRKLALKPESLSDTQGQAPNAGQCMDMQSSRCEMEASNAIFASLCPTRLPE